MRPSERAAKAIAENRNRNLSDRAIAEKIGVSDTTVLRARTASKEAVVARIGRDGKVRRMPKRKRHRKTPIDMTPGANVLRVDGRERGKRDQCDGDDAPIAQPVERPTFNRKVAGSSPARRANDAHSRSHCWF